jgi:hypothetical protein
LFSQKSQKTPGLQRGSVDARDRLEDEGAVESGAPAAIRAQAGGDMPVAGRAELATASLAGAAESPVAGRQREPKIFHVSLLPDTALQ